MSEPTTLSTTHLIRRTGPTSGRQFTVPAAVLADGDVDEWFAAQPDEAGVEVAMEPSDAPEA